VLRWRSGVTASDAVELQLLLLLLLRGAASQRVE